MPNINFIDPAGVAHAVEAELGQSVMQVATENNIPGILADCGGSCACATCHAYIGDAWLGLLAAPGELEDDMLTCVSERRSNSRLTCQIKVSAALDGMVVEVADNHL